MTEVAIPEAGTDPGGRPGPRPDPAPGVASSLRALFSDRRLAVMVGLGFGSGLPLSLVFSTQSVWLREAGVSIVAIGVLSEMTFAYKLKFLWAPLLDRYAPPLLGRWLGHRRGWIALAQVCVALALTGIALGDPAQRLAWTVAFSVALGFAGATQDAVIDGWRITAAPQERQALMSSFAETGWRVGGLVSGAGAFYLAAFFGWRASYLCMALAMAPALLAALMAPVPERDRPDAAPEARPLDLRRAVVEPFRDLLGRLGPLAVPTLLLIAGFRAPGYISNAMAFPLFAQLHYGEADIATATKLFGFPVGLAGTFTATYVVKRIGLMPTLLFGTIFASASHLSLAYLAAHGDHGGGEFWLFAGTVSVDEFAYAFASIVLITYMSSLCAPAHAASQFALLSSLCAIPGSLVAGTSGLVIERVGFPLFFTGTAVIGLPVAALCWWVWQRQERDGAGAM